MGDSRAKSTKSKYYILLLVAVVAYAGLTMVAPISASSARYGLSNIQIRLLQLTLVLPIVGIWLVATYGASNFKYYSELIKDSPDGKALRAVSNGLLFLVAGSIITSLVGTFRAHVLLTGNIEAFTHLTQLLSIGFPLIAFYKMFNGSAELLRLGRQEELGGNNYLLPLVGFTVLSSFYTWAVLSNPYRNATPDVTKYTSFFLPDLAIVLFIIVPIVTTWLLGMLAASNIKNYHRSAKGLLYREALSKLANGILAVVVFSILIQFLGALGPSLNLSEASLKIILIFIYFILALYAVGYILIALGAKRLTKIEEVK